MNDRPSYVPPVGIGEVMRALTVGEVIDDGFDLSAIDKVRPDHPRDSSVSPTHGEQEGTAYKSVTSGVPAITLFSSSSAIQEYALSDGSDLMKADLSIAPAPAWLNSRSASPKQ